MRQPKPRSSNYLGMREDASMFNLGTWLESESITYPSGAMTRRARAINSDTGKLQVVRCGISDTFWTISCRGGGYLDITDGRILRYTPPKK